MFGLFKKPRVRYERFGGIVATDSPPTLLFVDREWLRASGRDGGALWEGGAETDRLTAPTEVHYAFTHRCTAGCAHCYTDSAPEKTETLDLAEIARVADALARMGVFHVALGGGESVEDPRLLAIAGLFRERGIVPNLTTNGLHVTEDFAREAARVFEQINVSVDGLGADYGGARGYDGFEAADAALRRLRRFTRKVGINCVLTRRNFALLPEIAAYARRLRLNNVEFLRVKPAGRGKEGYLDLRLTPEQGRALYPAILALARGRRLALHVDCSLAPFLCFHAPDPEKLARLGLFGCEAGNVLAAVGPSGAMTGCSFDSRVELEAREAPEKWDGVFERFRAWPDRAPEPCRSCPYLRHCKGGCRVVAEFLTGDAGAPDPECPRVVAWNEGRPS